MRHIKPLILLATLLTLGVPSVRATEPVNSLTMPEELSGWRLLFDGSSTDGWRNYQQEGVSDGWKVEDGALVRAGDRAGDIITDEQFQYFELSLEYKISKGGNSGVMFHVTEDNPRPWHSGPEIQVQDNVDGHDKQLAGWLYQLYQPTAPAWVREQGILDATRPVGEWNQIFLRISPRQCEVSMNGNLYYRFKLGSADWKKKVAASKFSKFAGFGAAGKGHICLQDHGNLVSYRNVKIRELDAEGNAPQPLTGKLGLRGELAFPDLKWEDWSPLDEDDRIRNLRIMELTFAKGDEKRLFAAAQSGMVHVFENRPDVKEAKLFLDLRSKVTKWYSRGANEEGLLGLAFHPKYSENGYFYVYYNRVAEHTSVIARYTVSKNDPNRADPGSEVILLEVPQPYQNHNGGSIEFGPDGYLYIGMGDGGLRNDPKISAQDPTQLLGKILRIDVDGDSQGAYGIPADNPFVDLEGARPEIYAMGLRNPWRLGFDSATGRLWVGDVGQELWEEVNLVTKGGNYGWSRQEGSHSFGNKPQPELISETISPVWEYDHSIGKSITGGRVYNNDRVAALTGKYIYADYVSGAIWALTYDESTGKAVANEQVIANGTPVLAFGEDPSGEVFYMIDSAKGQCIHRFVK